jgi:hypothetical protein
VPAPFVNAQEYERVPVPPEPPAKTAIPWPTSIAFADEGEEMYAIGGVEMVTVTAAVAVLPLESVTLTQYVVVEDNAPVLYELDAPLCSRVPVHEPMYQAYVGYVPEPEEAVAVKVTLWPLPIAGFEGLTETDSRYCIVESPAPTEKLPP